MSMEPIYWRSGSNEEAPTTNVCYNCFDRHMSKSYYDEHELCLLWDGNYWDDNVHDYADISWEVVNVVINKVGNIFKEYCEKGDHVLLLLHNVIQMPISFMGASRIGAVSVILNPVTATVEQITELIRATRPKLIVTVDAFFQGHELFETKKDLDAAVANAQVDSIKRILSIRHLSPNDGVPPPHVIYPGKRPYYKIEFQLDPDIDTEWRKACMTAKTQCDPVWVPAEHPFAILPVWAPELHLRTISTQQILEAAEQLGPLTVSDCLSLAHPQEPIGLVGCVAIWLAGKTLAIFEGTLDHPDPSRLKHLIKKFELKSIIISRCKLDLEYMGMVPVPTLSKIITDEGAADDMADYFPGVEIVEWNVERALGNSCKLM